MMTTRLLISLLGCSALALATLATPGAAAPEALVAQHQPAQPHSPSMPSRAGLKPAEGASVKILSPRAKQVVAGDGILLKYGLVRGKRGSHVHVYVDGKLVGMFKPDPGVSRGEGTLPRLAPGGRTLEVRVVADDHETELDATAVVTFTVK